MNHKTGKWARYYDECKNCHTKDIPHAGHGLCKNCFFKNYYTKEQRSEYYKDYYQRVMKGGREEAKTDQARSTY